MVTNHYSLAETEEIYDNLSPPPDLETLRIFWFFENRFPTWVGTLHDLTSLELVKCLSFQVLPPLGNLRQLKVLYINSADSIVTISFEFLGLDSVNSNKEVLKAVFSKLEKLTLKSMPNWDEWTSDMKEIDGGQGTNR